MLKPQQVEGMAFDHPLLPQVDQTLWMAAARRSEGNSPFIGNDAAEAGQCS